MTDEFSARDFFISFAGEDRASVAQPLALALQARGFSVWFDEFELAVGDSLSAKIDEGLAKSRFGVVILSKSFFRKNWPRRELAGLTARQTSTGTKVTLPVWHGVEHSDVVRFSPPLADLKATSTAKGIDQVADDVLSGSGLIPGFWGMVNRLAHETFDRHGSVSATDYYPSLDYDILIVKDDHGNERPIVFDVVSSYGQPPDPLTEDFWHQLQDLLDRCVERHALVVTERPIKFPVKGYVEGTGSRLAILTTMSSTREAGDDADETFPTVRVLILDASSSQDQESVRGLLFKAKDWIMNNP